MIPRLARLLRPVASWLWRERLWWMIPLALALLAAGLLALVGPSRSPFIYALY